MGYKEMAVRADLILQTKAWVSTISALGAEKRAADKTPLLNPVYYHTLLYPLPGSVA